jgi:hypothetical protein
MPLRRAFALSLAALWFSGCHDNGGGGGGGGTPPDPTTHPTLSAWPTSASFSSVRLAAAPAPLELEIDADPRPGVDPHVEPLQWTAEVVDATSGGGWVTVAPAAGGDREKVTVTMDPSGLPPGVYTASVKVSAPTAKAPLLVPIRFTVLADAELAAASAWFVSSGYQHMLRVADLDGDGRPDVVVASAETGTLTLFRSREGKLLEKMGDVAAGTRPVDVVVTDLDGDGKADLAVVNGGGSVTLHYGVGGGTFASPSPLAVAAPTAVAVCDLDGDGLLDLAVASGGDGGTNLPGVQVFLGAGGRTYGSATWYAAGPSPGGVVCADLDGDGKLDLAVTDAVEWTVTSDTLAFLKGDGLGGLAAPAFLAGGSYPRGLIATDLNGNGIADVVVASDGTGSLALAYGADGAFAGPVVRCGGTEGAVWVVAGDVTGDGKPDLVYTHRCTCDSNSTVLVNIGGAFGPISYTVPMGGSSAALADLDGDGVSDYVVTDWTGWLAVAHRHDSLFDLANTGKLRDVRAAVLGDLDGDGKLDLVLAGGPAPDGVVEVGLGDGQGYFGAPATYAPVASPSALALGDLDEDGHLDLMVADGQGTVVAVMRGQTGGTFGPAVNVTVESLPSALLARDLDGDGHLDLAVVSRGGTGGMWAPNGTLTILRGDGHGGLTPAGTYTVGGYPSAIAAADLDGDGRLDLVISGQGYTPTIMLGKAGGGFQQAAVSPNLNIVVGSPLALADVNGDGKAEIVTTSMGMGLAVVGQAADGTFQILSNDDTSRDLDGPVVVGDFNGDGRLDLAVAGPSSLVTFLLGDGEGRFHPALRQYVTTFPVAGGGGDYQVGRFILAADLNGDGKLDVVTNNGVAYDGAVAVLMGR